MKINLSPQRRDDDLKVFRMGDVLTINGESFDFTELNDGDTLPIGAISCEWFVGPVTRSAGELELTLILPLPPNFSQAQAFPMPVILTSDGFVNLPQPTMTSVQEPV